MWGYLAAMIPRVALFMVLVLAGCQIPAAGKFEQMRKGMTESEVVALLGEPSSKARAQLSKSGQVDVPAHWQYGDNLSTFATDAMFQDQPPSDRVWVVFFDADGKTTTWQKPAWDH